MTIEKAWLFACDQDDCDEEEFMADSEGSGPPMEWTEDEEADQHRCGACTKKHGELSFGSFRQETAKLSATGRRTNG